MHSHLFILFLSVLATLALARTDLSGCTSSETVIDWGASYIWWVPGTGEICSLIDCGGGRAPPATTVPGCPQYVGTATYSPQYLPGYNGNSIAASTTSSAGASTSQSSALITGSMATASKSASISSSSHTLSSSVSSAVLDTFTSTPSESQAVSSSASSTQSLTKSSSTTNSAVIPTNTGNSGTKGVDIGLLHGVAGVVAAAFAFSFLI